MKRQRLTPFASTFFLEGPLLGLLVASALVTVLLPFLFIPDLSGSSEAREAQVADVIYRTGEWILPLRNGLIPSKPPLLHWIAALFAIWNGSVTPGIVRLVSLLSGGALVWLTAVFSGRMVAAHIAPQSNSQSTAPRMVSSLAILFLLCCYPLVRLSIDARVDMLCAVWMTGAVFSGITVVGYGALRSFENRQWLYPMWLCMGLAVLTKGPLGVVLPTVMIGAFSFYVVGWRPTLKLFLIPHPSWALFIGSALPWYWAATMKGQAAFIERQFFFENVKRVLGDPNMNSEPWWFYIPSFLRTFFPLSVISLLLLWNERTIVAHGPAVRYAARARRGIAWSIGAALILFSAVSGKRHSYLLPVLPLLSLYSALAFAVWNQNGRAAWIIDQIPRVVLRGSLIVLVLILLLIEGNKFFSPYSHAQLELVRMFFRERGPWIQLWIVVLGSVGILGSFIARNDIDARLAWSGFWIAGVLGLVLTLGSATKACFKPFRSFAQQVATRISPDTPLYAVKDQYNEYLDPIFFYLKREVVLLLPGELRSKCGEVMIAQGSVFEALRRTNTDLQFDLILQQEDRGKTHSIANETATTPFSDDFLNGVMLFRCFLPKKGDANLAF